uniref:Ig-like domain-containing protein n=1 Tax=Callorhinchus milii TaxID=7868 RepID=A0A4W3H173_CALMI
MQIQTSSVTLQVNCKFLFSHKVCSESRVKWKPQTVSCDVTGSPAPRLTWTKDGKHLSRERTLHIQSVHMDDAGLYTCTATNKYGSTNYSLNVTIMYKPRNTTISNNKNKTTPESPIQINNGDNVTLTCFSEANPSANLSWEYPHQSTNVKEYPSGILFISYANSGNSGIYKCRAHNHHGTDVQKVEISHGDAFPYVSDARLNWVEGKPQTVSCDVTGSPAPRLTWTKDGKPLSREKTLHIQSVHMDDAGLYTCTATNKYGSTNYSLNSPIQINNGDNVTLTCFSEANPSANLSWEYPHQSTNVKEYPSGILFISYANSGNSGIYKCRAHNHHGTDVQKVEISVKG